MTVRNRQKTTLSSVGPLTSVTSLLDGKVTEVLQGYPHRVQIASVRLLLWVSRHDGTVDHFRDVLHEAQGQCCRPDEVEFEGPRTWPQDKMQHDDRVHSILVALW